MTNNAPTPLLEARDLHVEVNGKPILKGLSLTVNAGEVHAIMGPNGSGKSTLSHVVAGKPGYTVTGGTLLYRGQDLQVLAPEERARAGIFLAFQYPLEIPGVNNVYLLKAALNAKRKHLGQPEVDAFEFLQLVKAKMQRMQMDEAFLTLGSKFGKLDGLVHSVAYATQNSMKGPLLDCTREDFRVAHETSSYSLVALTKRARPLFPVLGGGE